MAGWVAIFSGIVVLSLLSMISLTDAFAQSVNTCGINFVSGNSVTYGNLQSGATSSEQIITLSNPGTVAATLSANGTNWTDGTQTSTATFTDNFASYADTTAGDLAYPTTDTVRGRVNPTTDAIDLSLSESNQLDEIHHDFGAGVISDTSWVLRFKLDISAFTRATIVGNEHKVVFQLASGLGTSEVPTDDAIGLNMKMNNGELGYYGYRNDAGSQTIIDTTYDPTVHTIFVELIRSSATTGTAKLFSDSGYSVQLGSTANIAPEATITGLRYFKVHLFTQSTNGQLIGTIDDVQFWNGVSQVPSSGGQTNVMNVGNTRFTNSSGAYSAKIPLTLTLQNIGTLQPSVNTNTYWQLQANLLNAAFTGNLTQTMNFRVSCDGDQPGGTTPTYPDGLGNTADGTAFGGVTTGVAGKVGNAWDFDGSNDYVSIGTNSLITGTGDFTISAWVYPKSIHLGTILGSYPATNDFDFYTHSNGKYLVNLQASGYCFSNSSYTINQWNHLVVTRSNGIVTNYLNGVADGSCANAGNINSLPTRIGASVTGSEPLNAKLDEISIWQRTISPSEVSQLYNSGNGNIPSALSNLSGLKAYYDFDQAGTTLMNQAIPPTPLAQQTSYTNNAVYGTALSGTGNSKAGIKVNADSTLIGKTVNTIEFPIIRSGSPTGTYYAEVYASDGSTLKYTFGSGDIATLSSSVVTWKTFTNTISSYTIAAGDKIVMRFSGGTHATNDLSLKYAESPSGSYDGLNTTYCYGNTCQNELTDADAAFKFWNTSS